MHHHIWPQATLDSHRNKSSKAGTQTGGWDPETSPHSCDWSVFVRHVSKDSLFNKWFGENWVGVYTRLKVDSCLSLGTKTSSKWMEDLYLWNCWREIQAECFLRHRRGLFEKGLELTGIIANTSRSIRLHGTQKFCTAPEAARSRETACRKGKPVCLLSI